MNSKDIDKKFQQIVLSLVEDGELEILFDNLPTEIKRKFIEGYETGDYNYEDFD